MTTPAYLGAMSMWFTEKPPREKPAQPSARVVAATPAPTERAPAQSSAQGRLLVAWWLAQRMAADSSGVSVLPAHTAARTRHEHERQRRAPEARCVDELAPGRHAVPPRVDELRSTGVEGVPGSGQHGSAAREARWRDRSNKRSSSSSSSGAAPEPEPTPTHPVARPAAGVRGSKHNEVGQRFRASQAGQAGVQHLAGRWQGSPRAAWGQA